MLLLLCFFFSSKINTRTFPLDDGILVLPSDIFDDKCTIRTCKHKYWITDDCRCVLKEISPCKIECDYKNSFINAFKCGCFKPTTCQIVRCHKPAYLDRDNCVCIVPKKECGINECEPKHEPNPETCQFSVIFGPTCKKRCSKRDIECTPLYLHGTSRLHYFEL